MAKKKNKNIEKETRQLIEAMSDVLKKREDGTYKIKAKNKKEARKLRRNCVHWISKKKGIFPAVVRDSEKSNYWVCRICGEMFPIEPKKTELEDGILSDPYGDQVKDILETINQFQFYAVKLGGDAKDTKMFLQLKNILPKFAKTARQIAKRINQREKFEEKRASGDVMSQFDSYSSLNYK